MAACETTPETDQPYAVHNFIGGRYCEPLRGDYRQFTQRGARHIRWRVPRSCARDVERAIDAAHHAIAVWSRFGRHRRLRVMAAAARYLAASRPSLERSEVWDFPSLTPLCIANAVSAAIATLIHPADLELAVPQPDRSLHPLSATPPAVVKQLFSSEATLQSVVRRIAPLLASGSVLVVGVVHKPAASSSGRVMRLLGLIAEQVPPGVLNIIGGSAEHMGGALAHTSRAVTMPLIPLRACHGRATGQPVSARFVLH